MCSRISWYINYVWYHLTGIIVWSSSYTTRLSVKLVNSDFSKSTDQENKPDCKLRHQSRRVAWFWPQDNSALRQDSKISKKVYVVHREGDQMLFFKNGFQWRRGFTTPNKLLLCENNLSFKESAANRLIFTMIAIQLLQYNCFIEKSRWILPTGRIQVMTILNYFYDICKQWHNYVALTKIQWRQGCNVVVIKAQSGWNLHFLQL